MQHKKNPNVKIKVKAFVDNGNTTFSGAVISQKLMNRLGASQSNHKAGKIKKCYRECYQTKRN